MLLLDRGKYMEDLKGWIRPSDKLPEKSYCRKFLVIVKNKEENMNCLCPYQIMLAEWSGFVKVGDSFSCWSNSHLDDKSPYNFSIPIPMERVMYWRPFPEVPDDIKNRVWS
ncbi:hypothetical protein [Romboutsia ilealis]|uniref:hypothetical protein n=1 Tax=Romboutsia ilealis TaxID=1115758 RepID=UPI0026F3DBC0|nr:hypothetical protein [Romboutsia ilealis]